MPKARLADSLRHDFPGRRWVIVALRALHLVAVIALGAQLLGAPAAAGWPAAGVAAVVLGSGLAMLGLDLLAHRQHLRTVAGLTALVKLLLVAILAAVPELLLFWVVVVLSAVVSHAPATLRHFVVLPAGVFGRHPPRGGVAPKTPREGSDPDR
jgi:hypothetical protein